MKASSSYLRTLIPFGIIAVCFAITYVINPNISEGQNLQILSMEAALLVVAAIGQMMIMVTGNIDISCSSVMAVAGFTSSFYLKNNQDASIVLPILIALGLGLLLGLFNGLVIGYGEIPAIIVTLGTLSIYRGVTYIISGSAWVLPKDLTPEFRAIATGESILGITNLVWIALFLCLAAGFFLNYTRMGRNFYAIGSHQHNAGLIGINIRSTTCLVYIIGGVLFGLTGILLASRYNFAQNTIASGYELTIIAVAVIGGTSVTGGRGTILGVIAGAILLSFIVNAMNVLKVSPFWKMAIQGVIILIAVIIDTWLSRRRI